MITACYESGCIDLLKEVIAKMTSPPPEITLARKQQFSGRVCAELATFQFQNPSGPRDQIQNLFREVLPCLVEGNRRSPQAIQVVKDALAIATAVSESEKNM